MKHFRVYLLGIHLTLIIACNAIKIFSNKRDSLPRIARWFIYLPEFDFNSQYRKGSLVVGHVDFLSRNPLVFDVMKQG